MITLGILEESGQLSIRKYQDDNDVVEKIIDPESLKEEEIDALFYRSENISNNLIEILNEHKKYYPISPIMDVYTFTKLSTTEAHALLSKTYKNWVLSNNLNLISDVFTIKDHLKNLLHSDRTNFFEELWFILMRNLGTKSLTIIYKDLRKGTTPNEKDGLTYSKIVGKNGPTPIPAEEIDNTIMENYKNDFNSPFNLCEYNISKEEIVATAVVNGSPILIMGKASEISPLQKAIFNGLFKELQK